MDCYRLAGGSFVNEYYIVSEAETRKLMNHPEVVGYEVYASLVTATSQMMYYLKEQKKITSANILSILRGALNYPLEESCYKEHIRVHDISFMSSERVFGENDEMSLDIKYCKLTMVPNSTLMIGDIIASGETLVQCLRYVTDYYRKQGAKLRNILLFTIGGISSVYVGGNDIFEVMINLGLFYLAILVLGLNIWTTNDNALYSAGLGLANIFGQRKKPMVLVSGIIGTVLAVWLYWNFTGWLNILNCTLPPVGIILVMSFFMDREKYKDVEVTENVNWFAVFGVVLGAVVANLVPWGIASINGMIVAAVCYLVGSKAKK